MARPIHAIDEENVLPAVAVVVEKSATRPQRLRQVFAAECAAIVNEIYTRRLCNFGQAKRQPLAIRRPCPTCTE